MFKKHRNKFLSIYIALICFLTYTCVYAFRKPFTVGLFLDQDKIWGVSYKNVLVIAQVLGYALSKFIGIRYISQLTKKGRGLTIILLVIASYFPLYFFPHIHAPWNIFFLFLNGLPLGVLWGVIFSFVEGRRYSDFIGASMAVSFIFSSGLVKSVAKYLQQTYQLTDQWIPFYTSTFFLFPLIFLTIFLDKIPDPTPTEIEQQSERVAMNKASRKYFFKQFFIGLISFISIYIVFTLFRDIRDNFSAELWNELGYGNTPFIFSSTEIPVSIVVLLIIASMMFIKNNKVAFCTAQFIVMLGFVICGISTLLFQYHYISGFIWMMGVGLGLYMGYIPFNSIIFDRMIASFRIKANVGYFMYLVDSFGYLASAIIIIIKGSISVKITWTAFYTTGLLIFSAIGILISVIAYQFFLKKYETNNL